MTSSSSVNSLISWPGRGWLTSSRRHDLVQHPQRCPLPDPLDGRPEQLVGVVDVSLRVDLEIRPDEGEQRRVEADSSVGVEGHIHGDESLAGQPVGTEFSEAERRRDLSEQGDHVQMLDSAFGVRIVLGPETDELLQVVGTEDGPVPRQVVEVVHDDGHEQVDNLELSPYQGRRSPTDQERAQHEERDEIRIGKVHPALGVRVPFVLVRERVALDFVPARAG